MDFDLDQRAASLSVGEFSDFTLGPRDASGGQSGLWRAQLGTHWHQQLRAQTVSENAAALFEVPIAGKIAHRGWLLTLTGRIDQIVPPASGAAGPLTLREIKTVTRAIPADEGELRAEYPEYFVQLAAYAALHRLAPGNSGAPPVRAELHFVEVGSGLAQTIVLTGADDVRFEAQLERVTEFLELRLRARDRLRNLHFRPPFATLRPGQETTERDLAGAVASHPIILFEAPTGFGKTGVLLELALAQLHAGRFERLLYLTSKATGQIQVMRTLRDMTAGQSPGSAPVAAWLMRPKREHCIHTVYHCSREICPHLADLEIRWPKSGLARFYLFENHPRDLDTLRAAGRAARICPYEITRAALPFNDVWIGDYNYIFSPSNRGIFVEQHGYDAARTLLVVDEAHNLPSRVADIHSHAFTADDAGAVSMWFLRARPPEALVTAWEHWAHFLSQLAPAGAHTLAAEEDARDLIQALAKHISNTPLDYDEMPPEISELLWRIPEISADLALDLPRLWWSPLAGTLTITCLDAAGAIGPELREFGGVVLASATLTPVENFAAACGLDGGTSGAPASLRENARPDDAEIATPAKPQKLGELTKRDTKKLFARLTTGASLLALDEARDAAAPKLVRASTPWRDDAYDVAIDTRVNTTFQQRAQHAQTTAATVAALAGAARAGNVAVFFPSYAYAGQIKNAIESLPPFATTAGDSSQISQSAIRISVQPRLTDLAAQNAWVEQSLREPGVLFLVLGSSFAEGIDLLGGRISHAMVVGPALPEVNAVQRARLAAYAPLGRDEAARRVYQIPGIQKVNQALGRLVRAPGQRAKVLLHCARFAEKTYMELLAPEYQTSARIAGDDGLADWLRE